VRLVIQAQALVQHRLSPLLFVGPQWQVTFSLHQEVPQQLDILSVIQRKMWSCLLFENSDRDLATCQLHVYQQRLHVGPFFSKRDQ
jgi:hypothetical protein